MRQACLSLPEVSTVRLRIQHPLVERPNTGMTRASQPRRCMIGTRNVTVCPTPPNSRHLPTMTAPSHRFLEAHGLRFHVTEQGQGPLVLLCHGFPETSHVWRHQLPALARAGYRAVAPDLRGYGRSDRPDAVAAYAMRELVADLLGLVEALGESQAVVVGGDWGAAVAWQAARMHPERFRAVAAPAGC